MEQEQRRQIEIAVRMILEAIDEDPDRTGLKETPQRVARMYAEVFAGLHQDPAIHLERTFPQKYNEMVILRDLVFVSFCEHHLLPFTGVAHVAYLPAGRVVGLSKIPRLIDALARRPQVQENLTEQIADAIESGLRTTGVAVILEATHSCMTIRGVGKPGSSCVTSAMRGSFRENVATRMEVLSLLRNG